MQFGTKKSEVDEYEGAYLRNFREGDNEVRFIEECDDWIKFSEHYTSDGRSFPCTNDRSTCPGCTSDDEKMSRASRKYATNVRLVGNDMVLPFRIPMSLAKKLFNRSERNGTITNRDYIIMREGKGFETEYDLEQGDKHAVDLVALREQKHDIEEILRNSYEELWGRPEKEEAVDKPPFESTDEIEEARLRAMTKDQLIKIAAKNSIVVNEEGSKASVLDAILAAAG